MRLYLIDQISKIDRYTIDNEPILEVNLIRRAARSFFDEIVNELSIDQKIKIFAGPGNNGGDALALTAFLHGNGFDCVLYTLFDIVNSSDPIKELTEELEPDEYLKIVDLLSGGKVEISSADIVIDGIFGSGLNRKIDPSSVFGEVISMINTSGSKTIAIDIPSGLSADIGAEEDSVIIKASHTISFEFPKLSFFFSENSEYLGKLSIVKIGLMTEAIPDQEVKYHTIEGRDVSQFLKVRHKFSDKADYGHGLLIAGSYGMAGAAVLCSKAALRSGIGLLTVHVPDSLYDILQISVPEAMCSCDYSKLRTDKYNAIGIGPGLGRGVAAEKILKDLLNSCNKPMVIDADGINLISMDPDLLGKIPEGSILTPHVREFDRLAGLCGNSSERLRKQIELSRKYRLIIVLKGANTSVSFPSGQVWFNTTGNPGMATGGSGDVLTGILLGLISQGYTPEKASLLGVYIHGMAADIAVELMGQNALIASDIIEYIGTSFGLL